MFFSKPALWFPRPSSAALRGAPLQATT
jgi:hypothetical protein